MEYPAGVTNYGLPIELRPATVGAVRHIVASSLLHGPMYRINLLEQMLTRVIEKLDNAAHERFVTRWIMASMLKHNTVPQHGDQVSHTPSRTSPSHA